MTNSRLSRDNQAFWNRCFKNVECDFTLPTSEVVKMAVRKLKDNGCRRLLDLGCGFGRWAIALAAHGFDVTAVDISQSAIDWVRSWSERTGAEVTTAVIPAQEYVRRDYFDAILCRSVLDHMPIDQATLAATNIVDSLCAGGLAWVTFDGMEDDDPDSFEVLRDGTWRYKSGRRAGMLWRYYSDDEIRELFAALEVTQFTVSDDGTRDVWLRKPDVESS